MWGRRPCSPTDPRRPLPRPTRSAADWIQRTAASVVSIKMIEADESGAAEGATDSDPDPADR